MSNTNKKEQINHNRNIIYSSFNNNKINQNNCFSPINRGVLKNSINNSLKQSRNQYYNYANTFISPQKHFISINPLSNSYSPKKLINSFFYSDKNNKKKRIILPKKLRNKDIYRSSDNNNYNHDILNEYNTSYFPNCIISGRYMYGFSRKSKNIFNFGRRTD